MSVAAVVVDSVMKPVKNFFKVAGLALDKELGGMWSEAVGDREPMKALHEIVKTGATIHFGRICMKQSKYHSGGRYMDIGARGGMVALPLPPLHPDYAALQVCNRHGFTCNSQIAQLEGLQRGQRADVMGKVSSISVKMLKGGKAKAAVWIKDESDRRVLCELWGPSFLERVKDLTVGEVVRALNFSVNSGEGSVSLSGEYMGDSDRGSALFQTVSDGPQLARFESVAVDGGLDLSVPWTGKGTRMSAEGPCYVSCLVSVKNASLAFGDGPELITQPDNMQQLFDLGASQSKEALQEEIRVFVPGVWLVDIRDSNPVFQVCEKSGLKIDAVSGHCRRAQEGCNCSKGAEKMVLTAVTLADFSGSLRVNPQAAVRKDELCIMTNSVDLQTLEQSVVDMGVASLTFQARCDVLLGANKYNTFGDLRVVDFDVLQATPNLIAPVGTEARPLAPYRYTIDEAQQGQILAIPSIASLVETPAGPKVQATGCMPSHVCMLIQAADRVKADQLDNQTILVSHEKVKSLLDEDGAEFRLEALATLPDMFAFNVQNQTRLAVGAVKFRKDGPVFMANRVFALPDAMTDEEAKNCIAREIENVVKVPERSGVRRGACYLITDTPAKKRYVPKT
ncbi:unnamed protein product [Effrenium voratum]|uniref:Uncharacterized protein n=1 Tax=Effrenium voratum TaxID=2562239 RepID=A0AA36J069_9DINO|nr:unnamed protein product [Effrenium voratum]